MKVIGICGLMGSGKGTVGDILVKNHGFKADSFAASLKDATSVMFDWPRNLLEGDTKESREYREKIDAWWSKEFGYSVTPRNILQRMGTEVIRDGLHDNFWVLSLMKRLETRPDQKTVITDVRFPNEITAIKQMGGHVVWVRRGELPSWFQLAVNQNLKDMGLAMAARKFYNLPKENDVSMEISYPEVHSSEWKWCGNPNISYEINNNGTLEDLEKEVAKIANL